MDNNNRGAFWSLYAVVVVIMAITLLAVGVHRSKSDGWSVHEDSTAVCYAHGYNSAVTCVPKRHP